MLGLSQFSTTFSAALTQRINNQPLADLLFIEVFSGTAGLTAAVRRFGCKHSTGVDAHVNKQVKAPVLRIDLCTEPGQQLLWRILRQPRVVAIHLGPPGGTSSRARDVRRRWGPAPKPLRSKEHPNGIPTLSGKDAARVAAANSLYRLSGEIMAWACANGVLCSFENPARSHAWNTTFLREPLQPLGSLVEVLLHQCMFGSSHRKRTKFLCNHSCYSVLAIDCDGSHPHEEWSRQASRGGSAAEVEYPHGLCTACAHCIIDTLIVHGAVPAPIELADMDRAPITQASRAATGLQPRGKRLPFDERVCLQHQDHWAFAFIATTACGCDRGFAYST